MKDGVRLTLRFPVSTNQSIPAEQSLFEQVQATGAEVVQEPTDQPYGVRDCAFRDPAGNLVRINELR